MWASYSIQDRYQEYAMSAYNTGTRTPISIVTCSQKPRYGPRHPSTDKGVKKTYTMEFHSQAQENKTIAFLVDRP